MLLAQHNDVTAVDIVAEKVEKCRALLKELRMSDFSTELNKVLAYDTTGFEEGATLSYFAFLRDIHFNNESKVSVPERYRDEATLLQKYFNNPYPLSPAEFVQHGQDEQLILLEKMFTSQFWNAIVDLDESNLIDDSIVQKQVHFHAGLSFFNMRAYERAGKILNKMANEEKRRSIRCLQRLPIFSILTNKLKRAAFSILIALQD